MVREDGSPPICLTAAPRSDLLVLGARWTLCIEAQRIGEKPAGREEGPVLPTAAAGVMAAGGSGPGAGKPGALQHTLHQAAI